MSPRVQKKGAIHSVPRGVGNDRLRDCLERMTHDGSPVETYPQKLLALANEMPHTIRVLPSPGNEPLDRYNCVMYALGLVGQMRNPYLVWSFRLGLEFLSQLIEGGVLNPSEATAGGLVTWSSPTGLKHVGLLVSPDRSVSKWSIGQLLEHGLYEVPTSYGDGLAFYSPLEPKVLEELRAAALES
jgi:hypothetical protein